MYIGILITFCVILFHFFGAAQKEGKEQTECNKLKTNDSSLWTCKETTECHFSGQLPTNKSLVACRSHGNSSYVCCPESTVSPSASKRPSNSKKKSNKRKRTEARCRKFRTPTVGWSCENQTACRTLEQLTHSNLIVRCNNEDSAPKICCPNYDLNNVTEPPPTTTTPSTEMPKDYLLEPKLIQMNKPEDAVAITEQQCLTYAKARYRNETRGGVLLGQKPVVVQILDCVQTESLIAAGFRAEEKEFPHMAALGYGDDMNSISWACSGSLISDRFILSAAHCTSRAYLGKVKWAGLGVIEVSDATPGKLNTNLFRIVRQLNHAEYKPPIQNNDIALYELEKKITFSPSIRPVCLSTATEIPKTEALVVVTGWGRNDADDVSEVMLKADIRLRKDDVCKTHYHDDRKLKNGFDGHTMICAGEPEDNRDSCEGDSGGPLQIVRSGLPCMWTQIGITSSNASNCTPPGIYTKVVHYIPWIQSVVWP